MDIDSDPTLGRLPQQRTGVFISYSHKDSDWLEKLNIMLKPLVRLGRITPWDDTKITGGAVWRKEIDEALSSAKVAVLLVSPDFLASDFIAEAELPKLLQAAEQEGLIILWVAVRHSRYDLTPIEKYQAVNNPKKPLSSFRGKLDEELLNICKQIERAATTVLVPKVSEKEVPKPADSSVLPGAVESEIPSKPVQYDPTEYLVDFEDQQQLFNRMLADPREKRLMFIKAPSGHGKTSLLSMLCFHCEQTKDIFYCSIDSGGQPYDNPHFTLALVICDQLGHSPHHLARALQPLSVYKPHGKIEDPDTVSQVLAGVSVTHDSLRHRHIKELLKNAFLADLGQFVAQKGPIVCVFDSFESLSSDEEDWLLDALLRPVASGKLKGVMIVTAGERWPKINKWEWAKHTHLIDGLPKMSEKHIKDYAKKLDIEMSDEKAKSCWEFSAGGVPFLMAILVSNLRTLSEVA